MTLKEPMQPAPHSRSWAKKIRLMVLGTILGLILCEMMARLILPSPFGPFSHNPVIQKQADNVNLFELDSDLGHRLHGGTFIGVEPHKGLVSLDDIAKDSQRGGRIVVLNLGDSSTSGWASDVVAKNARLRDRGEELLSPFQHYKTYSDLLAEDPRFYVINAGVPGFTSLQGERYLKRLLNQFKQRGIHIDVVTVYFGNNDSAWNGNIEDKYLLPHSGFQVQLFRVFDQARGWHHVVPRVTPEDYTASMRNIVQLCRQDGIQVVLLEPAVPLMWEPGLRARTDDTELQQKLEEDILKHMADTKGTKVSDLLAHARELYQEGKKAFDAGDHDRVRQLLEEAREKDYLVPRLKAPYAKAIHELAERDGIPCVSIKDRIPLDDRSFFRDYCHPVEPANRLFAEGITKEIQKLLPQAAQRP